VLSHALLPEGFALNLGLKDYAFRQYLKESLIGRWGDRDERIHYHWGGLLGLIASIEAGALEGPEVPLKDSVA
jgi:hypothetical protein